MSDYHHLKPGSWKKRVSTCEFSQPRANGPGRSVSRFTVISNAAETEAETVQSYDPYRGSRILQPCHSQPSHAKITVHRDQHANGNYTSHTTRMRSGSNARRPRANSSRASCSGRPASSKGSLTSLQSNRQGTPRARGPGLRHKRGVDFSHIRRRSGSVGPSRHSLNQHDSTTPVGENEHLTTRVSRSQSPELPVQVDGTYAKAKGAPAPVKTDPAAIFTEELRRFSNNIAKDCDEAFKSSLIEDDSTVGSLADVDRKQRDSPFAFSLDSTPELEMTPATDVSSVKPWDWRPLPPLPSDQTLHSPTTPTSQQADSCAPSIYDADDDKPVEQVARIAVPISISKQGDRRVVSAPVQIHASKKPMGMPSISEDKALNVVTTDKARIVSAPPHTPPRKRLAQGQSAEFLSRVENTIRVVNSPTAPSPVKAPAPLNVRKKSAAESSDRPISISEQEDTNHTVTSRDSNGTMRKKRSWFRRTSKATTESRASTGADSQDQVTLVGSETGPDCDASSTSATVNKKKAFSFPFWKSNKSSDLKMSIDGMYTS